ncbi:MAG TPA: alpha/beta family hydrolase [Clostridia bacterium]|nr:alpha/beta family hydrolase [Clostridia bacterium]
MRLGEPQRISIDVEGNGRVSGLFQLPARARGCLVLAHGAGAGMAHPFMVSVADGLCERGIATLRFQFPYMEQGARRPDPPRLAQATVRAAVVEASRLAPGVPLFAGGKSFGGRMTSQAQVATALPAVRGLVFFGFPLHPAGKPSVARGEHLFQVQVPMLFVQGTRDALAELSLLEAAVKKLGALATLKLFEQADHSFHVPKRSGRSDAEIQREMLDEVGRWMRDYE